MFDVITQQIHILTTDSNHPKKRLQHGDRSIQRHKNKIQNANADYRIQNEALTSQGHRRGTRSRRNKCIIILTNKI